MSVKHDYNLILQPTNVSCTQTATAMMLSHYDKTVNLTEILEKTVSKDESGEETGSSMQQLGTYCLDQGYDVELYSFDSLILDLSWSQMPSSQLIEKLELVREHRNVASLGENSTKNYIKEYLAFLKKGGTLIIESHPTSSLLKKLVSDGPVCAAVSHPTMAQSGHTSNTGLRRDIQNDLENDISTHAVLIYGCDDNGNFLIADPWGNPEIRTLTSEHLIASIMSAQWLCDNILFRIKTPREKI